MKDRKVTFTVSTGYVGAGRTETFKLSELSIIEDDYETKEELEADINDAYNDWLEDNIETSWELEE